MNREVANPAAFLNTQGFTGVEASSTSYYWSSSSYTGSPADAWVVSMIDGFVNVSTKTVSNYVWPVRAGQ